MSTALNYLTMALGCIAAGLGAASITGEFGWLGVSVGSAVALWAITRKQEG